MLLFGSIQGNVKEDVNNDDLGDINLLFVQIQLTSSDGVLVSTTLTDVDGNHAFYDIPPGFYTVVELTLPTFLDVSDGSAR